jgi:hypothetical protein
MLARYAPGVPFSTTKVASLRHGDAGRVSSRTLCASSGSATLLPLRTIAWKSSSCESSYPAERESDFGIWWSLGWRYETAAALSRLVYSGGRWTGMVPHFSAWLAMGPGYRQVEESLPLPPLDYFHRFYADTALFGAPHAVRCVLELFGAEHVLFGTDTPLGPPDAIDDTIADLDAAGLSAAELTAVYAGDAQRLLGVR